MDRRCLEEVDEALESPVADRKRRGGGMGGLPDVDRRLTRGGRLELGRDDVRAKDGFMADSSKDGGGGDGWNKNLGVSE